MKERMIIRQLLYCNDQVLLTSVFIFLFFGKKEETEKLKVNKEHGHENTQITKKKMMYRFDKFTMYT